MKTFILREKTAPLFEFLARPFILLKFSPALISFMSLGMIFLACFFLYRGLFAWASVLILLNGLLDMIDGVVARKTGKATKLGNFTDSIIDKVSDAVIFSAYIILGLVDLKLGLFALLMMLLCNIVVINIEAIFAVRIGQMISTRFLRIVILVVLTPLQQFFTMFVLLAILSTYTFFERIVKLLLYVKKNKNFI